MCKKDRHYLETSIIQGKGSLESAKKTLDRLCTLKVLLPQFFCKHDPKKELIDTSGFMMQVMMPKLLKDNYRLFVMKILSTNFDSAMFLDCHRFRILISEYMKRFDYSLGVVAMIDCRDLNFMDIVAKGNIMDLRNCMSVFIEGYGLRIKGIHFISSSKTIETLVNLLKQVMSAKVANRITIHRTLESVHEHLPKEILPEEYGGNEEPLRQIYENWVNVLSANENVSFFRQICAASTNEKYRLAANYNEQILGMPGSFRTLTVD